MGKDGHAVVLGASMSGLLAARALTNHFERVTVIERDALPEEPMQRKGVPQGSHAHGLLTTGYDVMDRYFPGMMDDLEAGGAPRGDVVDDFLWYQYGGWKLRHKSGLRGVSVSRPFLEGTVRARVKALPQVTFMEGYDAEQPLHDSSASRVTGAKVVSRSTGEAESIAADMVVDATGRGSQSPKWLKDWGYAPPPETVVKVDVGYGTRVFERKPGDFRDSMGGVIAGTPPGSKRYAAVLAAEGPRWVVTLAGMLGDYPPGDEEGWLAWARSLPTSDVIDLATANTSIGPIATYRFPANQRRHYEKVERFPAGYLVVGDALCSFNPIYGQGMSAAALEVSELDRCLGEGADGLSRRFFKAAAKVADTPWLIATGEDFRYPEVLGKRPPMHGLINSYLGRVHRVATYDAAVCQAFMRVASLAAPPASVMKPGLMRRVLLSRPPKTAARA